MHNYKAQSGISCFQLHGVILEKQSAAIHFYTTLSVLDFINEFCCRDVSHKRKAEPLFS